MCCFSFIWRAGGYAWRESHVIRIQEWMEQMARNVTMEDSGFLIHRRYLVHDRDSKYCSSFLQVIEAGSVKTLALPARSPNLNAYAERWGRLRRNAWRS